MVDGGEDVVALTGQRDSFNEVRRQDRLSLRAQKVVPRNGCPAQGRIDAGGLEDLPHRGGRDRDTEKREFAVDASIPQDGFSAARRSTSRRIAAAVRGRPGPRFTLVRAWRRFIKSRCCPPRRGRWPS